MRVKAETEGGGGRSGRLRRVTVDLSLQILKEVDAKMVNRSTNRRAVKQSVAEGLVPIAMVCRARVLARSSVYRVGRSSVESRWIG